MYRHYNIHAIEHFSYIAIAIYSLSLHENDHFGPGADTPLHGFLENLVAIEICACECVHVCAHLRSDRVFYKEE